MSDRNRVGHVPESPTLPGRSGSSRRFDVADLYRGPVDVPVESTDVPLDEKLRQAYFWIVNHAIISPHFDIEYNDGANATFAFGDSDTRVDLPSGQSYSSFVLLPLLTFATRGRCLLVGGPGRGKTASAILMGVLAGHPVRDVRRSMQHGHPQMTVADLLGTPLPSDLLNATSSDEIKIAWRAWLTMRVRIIDEYNRIPTRTQSALLTVLGDGYAEMFDQILECPPGAWFLTANDDGGGGTYPVIEALKDRIDVVVQALSFNSRFLRELLDRIDEGYRPEEVVPQQILFSPDELDRLYGEILEVSFPDPVMRRLEFFYSQFEFFEPAGTQIEYMTKDTARMSGVEYRILSSTESGRDRVADIGSQTVNGLSVRALQTILIYAKALAYFRGSGEVEVVDLRQVIPFVLREKLVADADSPFFEADGNEVYRVDRVSWIRRLFDLSNNQFDQRDVGTDDPAAEFMREFSRGLEGLSESETRSRLAAIERQLGEWSTAGKLYGPLYDDILVLKYLHQRYTNFLSWQQWQA